MIKKLPNLMLAAIASVTINFEVSAQSCTPNSSNTTDGFTPAAPFTFPAGQTGQLFNQTLQVRVPDSVTVTKAQILAALPSTIGGFPTSTILPFLEPQLPDSSKAQVNSMELTGVAGLHAGFTFANSWCGGGNCVIPAQSNGCLNIYGTPTMPGDSSLTVLTSTLVTVDLPPVTINQPPLPPLSFPGGPTALPTGIPQLLDEGIYRLNVTGNPIITTNNVYSVENVKIYPQPASNNIFVDFTAVKSEVVNVEIYDLVGKRVYFETINIAEGFNHFQINSTNFADGMYIYTISDANRNQKLSNRIIVSK